MTSLVEAIMTFIVGGALGAAYVHYKHLNDDYQSFKTQTINKMNEIATAVNNHEEFVQSFDEEENSAIGFTANIDKSGDS